MKGSVFRSRIDAWIGLALLATGAVAAGSGVRLMLSPVGGLRWLAPLLFFVGGGLPLWILATTRYAIGRGRLLVLSGPLRWSIPFEAIRSVRPSRAAWSAPALSLERLRIDHGAGRSCLVSPLDRDGFLAALREAGVAPEALPPAPDQASSAEPRMTR